jgi:hypothetical protein
MRLNVLSVAFAILLSFIFLDSASADARCGPGFHRNPYGRCTPNDGRAMVPPAAPVVVTPETPVVVRMGRKPPRRSRQADEAERAGREACSGTSQARIECHRIRRRLAPN